MFNTLTRNTSKKIFLLSLLALVSITKTFAAILAPVISSFSPTSGPVGASVVISGSNFNATASSDIVFFGATMATVTSASATSLTVTVPAGATYAPITVLNGSAHLSGYSKNQFIVTFTGSGGISTSTFGSPQTFATGSTPLFVAVADIDGDGKPDIVVIDQGGNDVGVYLNKSSGGSITSASFAAEKTFSVGTGAAPSSIAIGDIDGDGKPDVVTSDISNGNVSVLRNTSSTGNISFATHADFACGSNTDPNFVAIADFDGDGKPDLAVTDEATSKVSVFLNTTTSGSTTITFAAHADFGLPSEPGGIAVGDFDGDGKTDIAATIGSTTEISVLHNTSTGSGNINFAGFANFTVGNSPIALTVSDVDGDGKLDIVVANAGDGTVSILRNNSSSGISFVAHQDITVDDPNIDPNESFYYILMNDLDGDGKPDMIVVDNDNALYLLKNNSSSGSPSFGSVVTVPVGTSSFTLYGVAIGDLNSDGKPDMVANANGDSQIDVLQNNSAGTPTINAPGGTVTVPSTPDASTGSSTSFNISGSDLVANITATAPNNFQVSADNSNWGSTATITESGGTVSNAPVYVRLTGAGTDGSTQSGNVALNSTNAATVDQAVSGTLLVSTITAPGGTITLSSTTSGTPGASASFNISAANLSPSSGKLAIGAPTNVQVSPDNSTWSTAYLQSYSGGALAGTPVYVRLKGTGTVGTISGNVEISGGGASFTTTQQVSGTLNTPAASTTTSLSTSLNPSYTASPNNSVIFTATIYSSGTVNEGTVSFTSNGSAIPGGTDVPVSNGAAVVTTSFSVAGAYSIVATYNGDANYSSSTSTSLTQNVDLHPTTISSLSAVSSTTTNANSIQWTATFAASVSGLSTADFMLNTTGSISGAAIAAVSGSGTSWTITVNTGSGDGSIQLVMNSSSGVSPSVSNLSYSGDTYTIDKTAPAVTSFTATDASPTNSHTLHFQITFSEPVTGVDATDFSATTSNTSGGIISVSPVSSTVYNITVTSANGSGTYQLDLNSSGTAITDAAGNAISGGATGPTYTIDQRPPTVSSIALVESSPTNATAVDYTVTFSKPVTGVATGAFSLTTTSGNAAGTINSVTSVSSSVYTVNVTGVSGNGGLRLDLNSSGTGITDMVGNAISGGYTSGSVYAIDNTPATLTSGSYFSNNGFSSQYAKVGDVLTLSVGYSEQLQSATMTIGGNSVPVTFSNNNQNFSGTYTMTSGDTEGNVPWTISVTDLAGNVTNHTNTDYGTFLSFDKTPPAITISAPSAAIATNNGTASVTYTVSYSDANFKSSTLSNSDITLNTTGTAAGTTAVSGSGTSYTVTVTNITGLGTLGISIGANTAIDIPGNLALAAGPSATFNVFNNDDALSGLTLSNGTLSPGFIGTTTSYTAAVGYGLASINITPTTHDPNATVTINGHAATSGSATAVPLIVGVNNVLIVITAQDGSTQQTYTVTITEAQSYNNNLASLRTSAGFAQGTTVPATMNENVVNSVSSLTVTPTVADPTATVTVNGTTVTSGQPSASIPLSVGKNGITIVVTAQDTRTQSYTLTVTRAPSASDNLSNLVVSSGTLSPAFGTATNYLDYVANGIPFSITPTVADPTATLTINGTAATSGAATTVPLTVGNNTVTIVVTAQNTTSTKTYTVVVNEARSPNSTLFSLATNAGFSQGQTVPTTLAESVPNATSTITVTPTVADNTATVTVNGIPVTSGAASGTINLNVGANTITIVGTAQNGNTTTYTLTVTRAASSLLTNIAATAGSLSPAFASTTTSYAIYAVAGTTSTTISPTAVDPNATITVNGRTVTSGTASQRITTRVGNTNVTVAVTAADNSTTTTYTVGINVARSSNNALLSLVTSGGLSQGQTVPTTLTESVPNATSSITVTPTTVDAYATVTVNNVSVTSGSASGAIALNVGNNTITTVVTAQNGATLTYTLTVTRAPSANLSNLTLSSGSLSPAFASGTTAYSAAVANSVSSITVTPTATDPNATIKVNGATVASGSSSSSIPLTVGNNNITVTVTAADNSSTITYNVGVNRARSADDVLFSFKTSAGLAKGKTVPTTLTESVVNATSTITVTPTVDDATATVTVNNVTVASGTASASIALAVGSNTITTVVTAQSGVSLTYTLTVTRAPGSMNTVYQPVSVTKPTGEVKLSDDGINVHQGVSPNGDGINDYLQIDNISLYPDNNLKIMNRNGQLVFEVKGYDNATKVFDGHSNKTGQMQLPGTYFYELDYTVSGVTKHKTGFLVLKY